MARDGAAGGDKALTRWRALLLETYISLPLFALLLLVVIWSATLHFIDVELARADQEARVSIVELGDTVEAQMARNLGAIDQTLKVVRYAVQMRGAAAALPALEAQGLLPSALVFTVRIADRDGLTLSANPAVKSDSAATDEGFVYHRVHGADHPFVSRALAATGGGDDAGEPEVRLHFTRRIDDADGRFAGIAMVEVEPAYFTSGYESSRLGQRGLLGLVGEDGLVRVLRIGDQVSWGQAGVPANAHAALATAAAASPWDGVLRYSTARPLHGFPLGLVVGLARDEQLAAFRQHRRSYLWQAGLASAALVLVVALVCGWSWQMACVRRSSGRAQKTYAAASEASPDAFFVLRSVADGQGGIADFVIDAVNGRAESLTGMSRRELVGALLCTVYPALRTDGLLERLVHAQLAGGVHEDEYPQRVDGGQLRWLHRQLVAVDDGVVVIVRDISERKLAEERLFHMAQHDTLTGLPNRSLIGERIDQAIEAARAGGHAVNVAFIDLDGFKMVNDGLGHNAGDMLLDIVSARMRSCVGAAGTVGRFGGDEFVIILPGQALDGPAVPACLEQIRTALTEPITLGAQVVGISCSMGVVAFPRDGDNTGTLLMKADAAMYRAKERGKNAIHCYTGEMSDKAEQKLQLLEGLRHALEGGQLQLLYQPQVDLRSGRIFGVEALLRWQHPQQGLMLPPRFIALAEESGLIVEIGAWVLRQACRQNRAWRDAGLAPLRIAVNVSPRQFEDKGLVEQVAAALEQSGLDAGALELEVTESAMMRDLPLSLARMGELEAMGVSLSIDDFGTGYSNLSALKSFPIGRLKIDKSFIADLGGSADDQAIAMAIISLGRKLNLRVIAEGVESELQRRFLADNDCDEMQGYLFSKPVGPAEIVELMRAQAQDISPAAV